MADNKGVITAVGRKKLCMAHAGDIALPVITQMAWGSGGADETGQPLDTKARLPAGIRRHWRRENWIIHTYLRWGCMTRMGT